MHINVDLIYEYLNNELTPFCISDINNNNFNTIFDCLNYIEKFVGYITTKNIHNHKFKIICNKMTSLYLNNKFCNLIVINIDKVYVWWSFSFIINKFIETFVEQIYYYSLDLKEPKTTVENYDKYKYEVINYFDDIDSYILYCEDFTIDEILQINNIEKTNLFDEEEIDFFISYNVNNKGYVYYRDDNGISRLAKKYDYNNIEKVNTLIKEYFDLHRNFL